VNGTRELFSTGQLLINPRGLSCATDGNILVMDLTRGLIEVDVTLPPSANQSYVVVNSPDNQPLGLTVVPEPAVTIMLASALILLLVFHRRHGRRP
jgi:hypothetical protein